MLTHVAARDCEAAAVTWRSRGGRATHCARSLRSHSGSATAEPAAVPLRVYKRERELGSCSRQPLPAAAGQRRLRGGRAAVARRMARDRCARSAAARRLSRQRCQTTHVSSTRAHLCRCTRLRGSGGYTAVARRSRAHRARSLRSLSGSSTAEPAALPIHARELGSCSPTSLLATARQRRLHGGRTAVARRVARDRCARSAAARRLSRSRCRSARTSDGASSARAHASRYLRLQGSGGYMAVARRSRGAWRAIAALA